MGQFVLFSKLGKAMCVSSADILFLLLCWTWRQSVWIKLPFYYANILVVNWMCPAQIVYTIRIAFNIVNSFLKGDADEKPIEPDTLNYYMMTSGGSAIKERVIFHINFIRKQHMGSEK